MERQGQEHEHRLADLILVYVELQEQSPRIVRKSKACGGRQSQCIVQPRFQSSSVRQLLGLACADAFAVKISTGHSLGQNISKITLRISQRGRVPVGIRNAALPGRSSIAFGSTPSLFMDSFLRSFGLVHSRGSVKATRKRWWSSNNDLSTHEPESKRREHVQQSLTALST